MIEGKIKAKCSLCGHEEEYILDKKETSDLLAYDILGRSMGKIQDIFPKIPAWIRSGAIDQFSGGFCICPQCCE